MRALLHLIIYELKIVIRSNFHIVLLITLSAIIGAFYLIPAGVAAIPEFGNTGRVIVNILSEKSSGSLRETFLPVMLSFEVAILGFLFIAVTMFNEKEEGVIRSYRVTPSGSIIYVLSKVLTWTLISTLYGIVVVAATRRSGFDVLSLLSLLFVSTFFMTTLGLFVALFFKNMSDWFFAGIGALVINMLPQLSFSFSSFNPLWMKIIPGYYISTGFMNIMKNTGNNSANIILGLAVTSIVLLIMTIAAAYSRLMREGR